MSNYSTKKTELQVGWETWVRDFSKWKSFVTLTFRDIVTRDQSENQFRFLIQVLNRDLYGNHYTRIVGHSYFSYVAGWEHQKRGALHIHALIDKPINFRLIHTVWNKMAGFAWIEPASDVEVAVGYLAKYVSKGGELSVWKPTRVKEPAFKPLWYMGM